MASKYSVSLAKLIKELSFETIFLPLAAEDIMISTPDVNRPGLILAGYDQFFDPARINFLGISEVEYINRQTPEERAKRLHNFISKAPSTIIFTRGIKCPDDILALAKEFKVPVLATTDTTSPASQGGGRPSPPSAPTAARG